MKRYKKRIVWLALLTVGTGLLIRGWNRIDWAMFGQAQIPTVNDPVDTSQIKIHYVHLNGQSVLDQMGTVEWSRQVRVKVLGTCKPGAFQERPRPSSYYRDERSRREQLRRPAASLRLEIVRRSSLTPGHRMISRSISSPDIASDGAVAWNEQIWIPNVPGNYRLRLILSQIGPATNGGTLKSETSVIATASVCVVPDVQASRSP